MTTNRVAPTWEVSAYAMCVVARAMCVVARAP